MSYDGYLLVMCDCLEKVLPKILIYRHLTFFNFSLSFLKEKNLVEWGKMLNFALSFRESKSLTTLLIKTEGKSIMFGATTRIERERREKHNALKEAYKRVQESGSCMVLDDLSSIYRACNCENDPNKRWGERNGQGIADYVERTK